MVGIPNVRNSAVELKLFDTNTLGETSHKGQLLGRLFNKKGREDAKENGKWEESFKTFFTWLFDSAVGTIGTTGQYAMNIHARERVLYAGDTVKEIIDMMNGGSKLEENYGNNTIFNISGNNYDVQDNRIDENHNDKYRLYFDGESFYLRGENFSCLLENRMINADRENLLFESLFPYSQYGYTHLAPPNNKPHLTL